MFPKMNGDRPNSLGRAGSSPGNSLGRGQGGSHSPQPAPHVNGETRVLLVVLRKLTAAVELDRIFYIFSQFGIVEKISTFIQHGQNQVVVQFDTIAEAHLAMGYLNGKDLYVTAVDGKEAFCSLAIVPSRLMQLTFRKDDARNRDYTTINQQLRILHNYAVSGGASHAEEIPNLAAQLGVQCLDFLWGTWICREGWLEPPQDAQYRGSVPPGRGLPEGKIGECVHVSGLPVSTGREGGLNAPMIWAVCGQYGELVAVKLLAQHPGCAILQYKSKAEADAAIANLNLCRLWGSRIYAQTSRNANATHWRGAQTELEMRMCTADDIPPPAPAPQHITGPPGPMVAAWGLPIDDSAGAMMTMMQPHGVLSASSLGQGLATATFGSPEAAFEAICKVNGAIFTHNGTEFKACLHFANDHLLATPPIDSIQTPGYSSFNSLMDTPPQLSLSQQTPPQKALPASKNTWHRNGNGNGNGRAGMGGGGYAGHHTQHGQQGRQHSHSPYSYAHQQSRTA